MDLLQIFSSDSQIESATFHIGKKGDHLGFQKSIFHESSRNATQSRKIINWQLQARLNLWKLLQEVTFWQKNT